MSDFLTAIFYLFIYLLPYLVEGNFYLFIYLFYFILFSSSFSKIQLTYSTVCRSFIYKNILLLKNKQVIILMV